MKLISIVVPVYNTAYYLRRCIESILSQTYSNIEIIIINDGSTDKSSEIIGKYAAQDKRIIFIDKKNEGVSATRNIGINTAKGDYIAFVDSDDYIADNFVEVLLNAIENNGADLAICNYSRFFNNGAMISSGFQCPDEVLDTKQVLEQFIYNNSRFVLTAVVRLYSLEIIKSNNIRFYEDMSYGEDFIFQLEYALQSKKVCFLISKKLYFRAEENPYSLSKSSSALLWETQDKINKKLLTVSKVYNNISKAVALDCVGRFTQAVYGMIIYSSNYKAFLESSNRFFGRREIKEVLENANLFLPEDSKVKFLNAIDAGNSKFLYYKKHSYFKIRFFLKKCYIQLRSILNS